MSRLRRVWKRLCAPARCELTPCRFQGRRLTTPSKLIRTCAVAVLFAAASAPGAPLSVQLSGSGSGIKEFHHPDGWWQKITYTITANLQLQPAPPIAINETVLESTRADVNGSIRLLGTAEDHFFGALTTWTFDITREYDLRGKDVYTDFIECEPQADYVGTSLPFGADTQDPRLYGIKFEGSTGILTNFVRLPNLWWFDDLYPIRATATVGGAESDFGGSVTNACDGTPVPNALVTISSSGRTLSVRSDDSGRFNFSDAPSGPLRVTISADGYSTFDQTKGLRPFCRVSQSFPLSPIPGQLDLQSGLNETRHHTHHFRVGDKFILRRGDTFIVQWRLPPGFAPIPETLSFHLNDTSDPTAAPIQFPVQRAASPAPHEWWARLSQVYLNDLGGKTLEFEISIPPTAAVGEYEFNLQLANSGSLGGQCRVPFPEPVVVLFNPWNTRDGVADEVALDSPDERDEYVLAETGRMWRGSFSNRSSIPWTYSQFSDDALTIVLWALRGEDQELRRSAAQVARLFAAKANSDGGDNGIVFARWLNEGDDPKVVYGDGVDPSDWAGNEEIFHRFVNSGQTVEYGQCWVVAGVLTGMLRCVGMPTRPITNFQSGRDANGDGTITERAFEGRRLPDSETFWNYHVWCEAWMTRPDRPGFDGWQAVDGTPERSRLQGDFMLGPAPIEAIRNRRSGLYEVDYFCTAANGPIQHCDVTLDQSGSVVETCGPSDPDFLGRLILTKSLFSDAPQDLTSVYKKVAAPAVAAAAAAQSISTTLQGPAQPRVGEDVTWVVRLANRASRRESMRLRLAADCLEYNGTLLGTLAGGLDEIVELEPGQFVTREWVIPAAELFHWLALSPSFEARLYITGASSGDVLLVHDRIVLSPPTPQLHFTPSAALYPGESNVFSVHWTNTFTAPLTNAILQLLVTDGLRIGNASALVIPLGTVQTAASIHFSTNLLALRPGRHIAAVRLKAQSLRTIGQEEVVVVPEPPSLSIELVPNGAVLLHFPTLSGHRYTVLAADRPTGLSWRSVGGAVAGNGQIASMTFQRQTAEGQQFYRVQTETP